MVSPIEDLHSEPRLGENILWRNPHPSASMVSIFLYACSIFTWGKSNKFIMDVPFCWIHNIYLDRFHPLVGDLEIGDIVQIRDYTHRS